MLNRHPRYLFIGVNKVLLEITALVDPLNTDDITIWLMKIAYVCLKLELKRICYDEYVREKFSSYVQCESSWSEKVLNISRKPSRNWWPD